MAARLRLAAGMLVLSLAAASAAWAQPAVLPAAADTYLRSGSPNQNQGTDPALRVQGTGNNRALVRFEPAAITAAVGSGSLVSARLELYIAANAGNWGASGGTVDAHALAAPWTEPGATWNCPADANPANGSPDCAVQWSGGGFAEEPSDTVLHTNDLEGWVGFDVGAEVAAFLAGGSHHGWLIKKTEEGQTGRVDYASREAGSGTEPRLVLVVESAEHDETPPRLAITSPDDPVLVNEPQPEIAIEYSDGGSGIDAASLAVLLDGIDVTVSCDAGATDATCAPGPLAPGSHTVAVSLADHVGNLAAANLEFELLSGPGFHTLRLPIVADTYLRQGTPNQNQGSESVLRVRQSGRNRSLLRLEPAEVASLLVGTTVHSARLELFIADNGDNWGSSGRAIDLHALSTSWSELGATWHCADDADPTNQQPDCSSQWSGGSFEAEPVASLLVTNGLAGSVDFDVTAEVSAMADGGVHEGWLLKKTAEGQSGLIEFGSREGSVDEQPAVIVVFEAVGGGDGTPPVITPLTPEPESLVPDARPHIAAGFSDLGSGVDGSSARVFVDGIERTGEALFDSSGLSYTPPQTLGEGFHAVAVSVEDLAANRAETMWSFTVDSTAPSIRLTSPRPGELTNGQEIRATGRVVDSSGVAEVTVNGLAVPVTDGMFEASVALAEGVNDLDVSAVDTVGNTGSIAIEVTRFSLPEVAITSPEDLSTLASTVADVSGTVGEGVAGVTVNGVAATLSGSTFLAVGVPLVEGGNVLTATATDELGHVATDSVSLVRDLIPPRIAIYGPDDGATVFDPTISVRGLVNDIVAGTVNATEASVTVNGQPALVANRSFLFTGLSLDLGANLIEVVAEDEAGNTAQASVVVYRAESAVARIAVVAGNHQSAVAGTALPQPLVAELRDDTGSPVAGRSVFFRVVGSNGSLQSGLRQVAVASGPDGRAQVDFTLGTRAGVGNQAVEASAVGFSGPAEFVASALPGDPALIVVDSGDQQLGTAGRPLPRPLVAAVTDTGFNRLPDVPVRFTVVRGEGRFEGGANEILVSTDSDGRAIVSLTLDTAEGIANNVVAATIDGLTESPFASFVATGRAAGSPEATSISGVVLDNTNQPIAGVTMRVRDSAIAVETDSQGLFRIAGAPVGTVYLIADGSTAARPGSWPDLEFVVTTVPGRDTDIGMPIFLLPLDLGSGIHVDETHGGVIELPEMPGFALEIDAGSVTFPGGSRSGVVSATVVHADKVPMVPNFGQQPRLIVTIQPAGARFEPPARLVLPNVEGLAPGDVTEFYSFDHDLGHFVSIGPATVSEDGLVIASDPGVGIVKAGWHCGGNPAGTGTTYQCPECFACVGLECVVDVSANGQACGDVAGMICKDGGCICPTPTNMQQVAVAEGPDGSLRFVYTWESTSGNLGDLSACVVGEEVMYPGGDPFSWPRPWFVSNPNPLRLSVSATSGGFPDFHSPGFIAPLCKEASFLALQHYYFECPCHANGARTTLLAPGFINREVERVGPNQFQITTSKSGFSATTPTINCAEQ